MMWVVFGMKQGLMKHKYPNGNAAKTFDYVNCTVYLLEKGGI